MSKNKIVENIFLIRPSSAVHHPSGMHLQLISITLHGECFCKIVIRFEQFHLLLYNSLVQAEMSKFLKISNNFQFYYARLVFHYHYLYTYYPKIRINHNIFKYFCIFITIFNIH